MNINDFNRRIFFNSPESMDYPDTVHPLAVAVENGEFEKGIEVLIYTLFHEH